MINSFIYHVFYIKIIWLLHLWVRISKLMRKYFVAFGVGLAVLLQLAVLALSDLSGVSLVSRDSLFWGAVRYSSYPGLVIPVFRVESRQCVDTRTPVLLVLIPTTWATAGPFWWAELANIIYLFVCLFTKQSWVYIKIFKLKFRIWSVLLDIKFVLLWEC